MIIAAIAAFVVLFAAFVVLPTVLQGRREQDSD